MELKKETARKRLFAGLAALIVLGNIAVVRLSSPLNDYGQTVQEWPLAFDLFVLIPLLYALICRPAPREFLLRALMFVSLGIVLGAWLLPEHDKHWWRHLEQLRYLGVGAVLLAEAVFVTFLVMAMISALSKTPFKDEALSQTLRQRLGEGVFSALAQLECRMWFYGVFLRKPDSLQFRGQQHFSYAMREGNASNQLGFILLVVFETPLMHLLLHFTVGSLTAWLVSALNLYGALFLYAEYRATKLRPLSLADDALLIRCGIWGDERVPYAAIAEVSAHSGPVARQAGVARFAQSVTPSVRLVLRRSLSLSGIFNRAPVGVIYLAPDDPAAFIAALRSRLQEQA